MPSFTEFHWALPNFNEFYWVLLGFTGFRWIFRKFYRVLVDAALEVAESADGSRPATASGGGSNPATPRAKCRAKLQERRGSSHSLTIAVKSADSVLPTVTTPREWSATPPFIEFLELDTIFPFLSRILASFFGGRILSLPTLIVLLFANHFWGLKTFLDFTIFTMFDFVFLSLLMISSTWW